MVNHWPLAKNAIILVTLIALTLMPHVQAEALGAWGGTTVYPTNILVESCAIYSGYVYCVGGSTTNRPATLTDAVYYAPLSSGGVGSWAGTIAYPTKIVAESCVAYSGYIYCVGGFASSGATNAVYYAPLSSGGVGPWISTAAYPISLAFEDADSCTIYSGYIYCVGGILGSGYTNAVYYAALSSSGVGSWIGTTAYPISLYGESCAIYSGYIYCVGGGYGQGNINAVYYASVSSGGVGSWKSTTVYPQRIQSGSCVVYSGYIYCVGGYANAVYYAPVASGGVGPWTSTTAYPTYIFEQSCPIDSTSGYIYCVGGNTSAQPEINTNAVYSTSISTSAGQLLTTNAAPGSGSVSPSCPGGCSVAVGSPISVQASPDPGYMFSSWTVAGASCSNGYTSNPCTFTMSNNAVTVSATFTSPSTVTMTVSYSITGGGRGYLAPWFNYVSGGVPQSVQLATSGVAESVDSGSTWTLSQTSGGAASLLLGGSGGTEQWITTTDTGTASAGTIVFAYQNQYYLTMKVSGPGTVTPASGFYNAAQKVMITAKANSGHKFQFWTGTGTGSFTGTVATHTITMKAAITETANFT